MDQTWTTSPTVFEQAYLDQFGPTWIKLGHYPSFAESRSLVARHNLNLLQGIYFNSKLEFRSSCGLSGTPFRSKRRPRTIALSMQILSPIGLTQPRFMTNFRFETLLRYNGFCSDARVFAQMQCFCGQNQCVMLNTSRTQSTSRDLLLSEGSFLSRVRR